jgi:hypothetical protein
MATSPACSSDPAVSVVEGTLSRSVRPLLAPKDELLLEVCSTKGLGKPEKKAKPEPRPRPHPKPVLAERPALVAAAVLLLEAVAVAVFDGSGTLGRRPGGRLSRAGGGGGGGGGGELGPLLGLLLLLGDAGGGLLGFEGGFGGDEGAAGC